MSAKELQLSTVLHRLLLRAQHEKGSTMSRQQPGNRRQRRYDRIAILDYIDTYKRTHNHRSPSQRLIRAALNISAASVVHNMLHRLERAELLTITTFGRGLAGELEITVAGYEELRQWRAAQQSSAASDSPAPDQPE